MRKLFFLLSLLLWYSAVYAAGLGTAPMEAIIEPNKSATYIASNQLDKAIAVEVVLESWRIGEDGEEFREITNDLVAFPSQFILKGGTFKKIKVGLRESLQELDAEKTYRVTIRELPISLEPDEPGTFKIYQASAYRTSLYIQPRSAKPEVQLVESAVEGNLITLRFLNNGNKHIHLRNPYLLLSDGSGNEYEIRDLNFFKPMNGENLHAKIYRKFTLDLSSQDIPPGIKSATLKFDDDDYLSSQSYPIAWKASP